MKVPENDRPAIVIVAEPTAAQEDWLELLLGMEEEGIPFVIQPGGGLPLDAQAYQAAAASPLAVGVAVGARDVMVHEQHLAAGQPLFVLTGYTTRPADILRRLGCNAARLVKGLPFK